MLFFRDSGGSLFVRRTLVSLGFNLDILSQPRSNDIVGKVAAGGDGKEMSSSYIVIKCDEIVIARQWICKAFRTREEDLEGFRRGVRSLNSV